MLTLILILLVVILLLDVLSPRLVNAQAFIRSLLVVLLVLVLARLLGVL